MSLVVEMGNYLPKLLAQRSCAFAPPKADVSSGTAAEFLQFCSGPAEAVMPYKGTRGGQAVMRGGPAQPFISLSADVSSL